MKFLCENAGAVLDGATRELLEYQHLILKNKYLQVCINSYGDKIRMLAQVMPGRVDVTNTMVFIEEK